MGIDQYLNTTYKSSSSSNMEAYLEVMGISDPLKSKVIDAEFSLVLTKSGGSYTAKTSSVLRDHNITFTPGEEYEDVGVDGRTHLCLSNIEGNKIITNLTSDPQATIISEFNPDQVVITFSAGGVQAQQILAKA